MQISIKLRIAVAMLLLAALLVLIGSLGVVGMTSSNDANRDTYSVKLPGATDIGDAEISLQRERAALFRGALNPASPDLRNIITHSRDYRTEARQTLARFMALPRSAEEATLAQELMARRTAMDAGLDAFADALLSGNADQVMKTAVANNDLYAAYHDTSARLRKLQYSSAKASFESQEQSFSTFRLVSLASVLVGLVTAVASFLSLRSAISRPLGIALDHFDHIAQGDLTHQMHVSSNDEMGQLLRGVKRMQERLLDTVRSVRTSSETIASATRQMAAGNADLSSRTEEQAASLQQTAASIEELTSTVKHNAENAQQASQLAATSRQVSGEGREIVGQVVDTMSEIGESSEKIADITNIIEGIAFQTKIRARRAMPYPA